MLTEFIPPGGPFVRVDTFARTGSRIPAAYDSMIAKVIVWAPGRDEAIARMQRALMEFRIFGAGIATTAGFLGELLDHPAYRGAIHDTSLVEKTLAPARQSPATAGSPGTRTRKLRKPGSCKYELIRDMSTIHIRCSPVFRNVISRTADWQAECWFTAHRDRRKGAAEYEWRMQRRDIGHGDRFSGGP
jgi:acetyl/propionyl-CoA carboxylase alpha subunit